MDFVLQTSRDYNDPTQNNRPPLYWGQSTNDLVVDTTRDFAMVSGVNNLAQSMAKILVTERGSNIFTPMYGSKLNGFVGQNIDIDLLRASIKTDLIDTLRIYQFINKGNSNLAEQIDTLKSMKVDLIPGVNGIQLSFQVITRSGLNAGSIIQIEG